MGTLPPTALLLVTGPFVAGHFDSYSDIGYHFGVSIDDEGKITFRGEARNPGYVLEPAENGFTKEGAIRDWCKCHMKKYLPEYTIYRYLTR